MNYDELVKALRDDNACLSVKTLHEAADAIEELSKPRWIPVTERLPEDGVYVLARYKNNDMVVACVFEHDECLDFWRAMTDEGWCADCDTEPTHWMPLPEPPKEDT